MVCAVENNYRKLIDLFCLGQCQGFKELIQCTKASWHYNEGEGVFDQKCFPDKKVTDAHPFVQIGVRRLFHWKDDVTSDRFPADILRAISALAGRDLTEAFCFKSVDRALRWNVRYGRQMGMHSSPSFVIDRMFEPQMSSGQSVEEWLALPRPHMAG